MPGFGFCTLVNNLKMTKILFLVKLMDLLVSIFCRDVYKLIGRKFVVNSINQVLRKLSFTLL